MGSAGLLLFFVLKSRIAVSDSMGECAELGDDGGLFGGKGIPGGDDEELTKGETGPRAYTGKGDVIISL